MSALEPGWGFAANNFFRGGQREIEEILRLGTEVEQAGFASVWVGDHILWHTPIVETLTLLGAYAATTERITIGTAVLLLGLRQPAIGVKSVTSVNALSRGRFVLGVGVGGENPAEFEACGVPHKERGRRLDAALELLGRQWSDEAGEDRFEPVGPRAPILVGGRSDAARRRVLRYGDGWVAAFVTPRRIGEEVGLLEEAAGRRPFVALNVYMCIHSDHGRARAEAAEFLSTAYAMEAEPLMRYAVVGTPAQCAEQLAEHIEAGVDHFMLRPASWNQHKQLDQWAEELLPQLPPLSPAALRVA